MVTVPTTNFGSLKGANPSTPVFDRTRANASQFGGLEAAANEANAASASSDAKIREQGELRLAAVQLEFGNQMQKAGEDLLTVMRKKQNEDDKVEADDHFNKFQVGQRAILEELNSLQGNDYLNHVGTSQKKLEDLKKTIGELASSEKVRNTVNGAMGLQLNKTLNNMSMNTIKAKRTYKEETAGATVALRNRDMLETPTGPNVAKGVQANADVARSIAEGRGQSPEQQDLAAAVQVDKTYKELVTNLLAQKDPTANLVAEAIVEGKGEYAGMVPMSAGLQNSLRGVIKVARKQAEVQVHTDRIMALTNEQTGTPLTPAMAQFAARQIADPAMRAAVESALRPRLVARKAATTAASTAKYDAMIQEIHGGKPLEQLDPTIMSQLTGAQLKSVTAFAKTKKAIVSNPAVDVPLERLSTKAYNAQDLVIAKMKIDDAYGKLQIGRASWVRYHANLAKGAEGRQVFHTPAYKQVIEQVRGQLGWRPQGISGFYIDENQGPARYGEWLNDLTQWIEQFPEKALDSSSLREAAIEKAKPYIAVANQVQNKTANFGVRARDITTFRKAITGANGVSLPKARGGSGKGVTWPKRGVRSPDGWNYKTVKDGKFWWWERTTRQGEGK